jgi:hypothetical protein
MESKVSINVFCYEGQNNNEIDSTKLVFNRVEHGLVKLTNSKQIKPNSEVYYKLKGTPFELKKGYFKLLKITKEFLEALDKNPDFSKKWGLLVK